MSKYNKKDFKKPEYNYIRVGDDYYKSITKVKADKSTEFEWRKTTRQSILDDHWLGLNPAVDGKTSTSPILGWQNNSVEMR